MSGPAFTVEVALTAEELDRAARPTQAYARRTVPRMNVVQETAIAFGVAIAGAALAVWARLVASGDAWAIASLMLVALVLGMLVMLRAAWRQHRHSARYRHERGGFLYESRRYVIGETGVDVFGASADAHWRWPAFTAAELTDGLVLLHADLSRAVIIPARAFGSLAEAERALAYIRERIATVAAGGP